MNAPHGDDLERRLAELFQQRAATVTHARRVDLDSGEGGRKASGTRPRRFGTPRENLALLAAAVVVLVALAGTVVGIQAGMSGQGRDHGGSAAGISQTGNGTGNSAGASVITSCTAPAPVSWRQAIAAGAVPVDRNLNGVVSANGGTGDYLAVQGNEPTGRRSQIYADLEVALFHGSKGKTIYTPEAGGGFPPQHSFTGSLISADPTGAISADWVTFSVAYPRNSDDPQSVEDHRYKVMLYERGTGILRTLAGGEEQPNPEHKRVRGAPVIAAGKVHWLAAVDNHPETTTLESWDLSGGSAAGSVQAPDATGLVPYGSGVAWTHTVNSQAPGSDSTLTLRNGAGVPLTQIQLDAAAGGSDFGFDGISKLSWLRYDGRSVGYSHLVPGSETVSHQRLIQQPPGVTAGNIPALYTASPTPAVYPFAAAVGNGSDALLDLRTGTAVALPAGHVLQAVVGDQVVFGTGAHFAGAASGSTGLSIVSLSALPPVSC